jgi:FKBP-type peptidyl-prolyl cis-trans isomerase 2
MTLEPGGGAGRFQLKVLELTENGARLDGNHPLAGLTLQFDLEVVDVVPA